MLLGLHAMLRPMISAALFDLDGLLVDSEPLWRRAEVELFATVGLEMTDAQCEETTGLRIDEVVHLRHRQRPWASPPVATITARIIDRTIALLRSDAVAKPGIEHAIGLCADAGLRLLVVSSSPTRLIEAALERLAVRDRFEAIVSAEHEPYGKPHPGVFLRAAESIDVSPLDCLVLEDSLNGVIAAKAARMKCIAVPERPDPRFALADLVLPSLAALDRTALAALAVR
jgi:beta-phosphoglucomutase-like phosphatase (HAD superfamily)